MFDHGYLGIDPALELPARKIDRPHRDFLQWHIDTIFKAS
jgi:hypothetical protein